MNEVLVGNRVLLRPISNEVTSLIVKWRNNTSVNKWLFFRENVTEETHRRWLLNYVETGKCYQFIIVDNCSEKTVGTVFIKNIDNPSSKGEFGIFLGEDNARGKGFGTEAARLILDFAFTSLGLNRVYLMVFTANHRAIRSYEVGELVIISYRRNIYKSLYIISGFVKQDLRVRYSGSFFIMLWSIFIPFGTSLCSRRSVVFFRAHICHSR